MSSYIELAPIADQDKYGIYTDIVTNILKDVDVSVLKSIESLLTTYGGAEQELTIYNNKAYIMNLYRKVSEFAKALSMDSTDNSSITTYKFYFSSAPQKMVVKVRIVYNDERTILTIRTVTSRGSFYQHWIVDCFQDCRPIPIMAAVINELKKQEPRNDKVVLLYTMITMGLPIVALWAIQLVIWTWFNNSVVTKYKAWPIDLHIGGVYTFLITLALTIPHWFIASKLLYPINSYHLSKREVNCIMFYTCLAAIFFTICVGAITLHGVIVDEREKESEEILAQCQLKMGSICPSFDFIEYYRKHRYLELISVVMECINAQ